MGDLVYRRRIVVTTLILVLCSGAQASVGWGTFNPGSLFSVRARVPNSPLVGVGWSREDHVGSLRFGVGDPSGPTFFRYHDGRTFAEESITDKDAGVVVTATWVLLDTASWAIRVRADPLAEEQAPRLNLFVYTSIVNDTLTHHENQQAKGKAKLDVFDKKDGVHITADQSPVGAFRVHVREPSQGSIASGDRGDRASGREQDPSKFHYAAFEYEMPNRPEDPLAYILKSIIRTKKKASSDENQRESDEDLVPFLPDKFMHKNNVAIVQRLLQVPFRMDVAYGASNTEAEITEMIDKRITQFKDRFSNTFKLEERGFEHEDIVVAQQALSSLLGGMGFFHGGLTIEVATETGKRKQRKTEPMSLLSATPSRKSFPRGFLWDEGFHQMLIQKWDSELSRETLRSWLSTMEPTGWIPREQTRGADAVSRFPQHIAHFMTQSEDVVNPPTLMMPARALVLGEPLEMNADGSTSRSGFADFLFDKLSKHVTFLAESQAGQKPNTFYWRGRSESEGVVHTLASGLDDYPRAANITESEQHLDLACWIAWSLKGLEALLSGDRLEIAGQLELVAREIYDTAVRELVAGESKLLCDRGQDGPACHEGYVTIFPLILGLEDPSSERLGRMLELMRDEQRMWSVAGLRSLSKADPEYGKKDGYWTGPIWMPINYLALAALKTKYAEEDGPFQELAATTYKELRANIVTNVLKEYKRTGTLWEQYNPEDGRGQRGPDFTGWTALIVLVMAEVFDGVIP